MGAVCLIAAVSISLGISIAYTYLSRLVPNLFWIICGAVNSAVVGYWIYEAKYGAKT